MIEVIIPRRAWIKTPISALAAETKLIPLLKDAIPGLEAEVWGPWTKEGENHIRFKVPDVFPYEIRSEYDTSIAAYGFILGAIQALDAVAKKLY